VLATTGKTKADMVQQDVLIDQLSPTSLLSSSLPLLADGQRAYPGSLFIAEGTTVSKEGQG
jgi:hypothetical protein